MSAIRSAIPCANPTLAGLALVVLGALVYGCVVGHGFVLIDDDVLIFHNPWILSPTADVARFWKGAFQGLFMPLTYSLYALEAWLVGGTALEQHPAVFHLSSLALHLAGAVLMLKLLLELLGEKALWPAFAGACLFLLHPVGTEAVAWASATKDVLAGVLGLGALLYYLRSRPILAGVLFIAALLAKPSAVALPLMAVVLEVGWRRRPLGGSLRRLAPWFAASLGALSLAKSAQPDNVLRFVTPVWARLLVAGDALTFYLGKLLFPFQLAPDYGRTPQAVLSSPATLVTWLIPSLTAVWLWRRARWALVPFALVVAGVLPVLGLVPFGHQMFSTVTDRYLYPALLGPALALSYLLTRTRGPRPTVIVVGLLALYAALSSLQARYWKSSETLFTHTLDVNPASLLAHNNLGTILEERGDLAGALVHYSRTFELAPDSLPAEYNRARVLGRLRHYEEAFVLFQDLAVKAPQLADVHFSLGLIAAQWGRRREALESLEKAARLAPRDPRIRDALTKVGRTSP